MEPTIWVKASSTGEKRKFNCNIGIQIKDFWSVLSEQFNSQLVSPESGSRLFYRSVLLDDPDRTLESYGIQDNSIIILQQKVRSKTQLDFGSNFVLCFRLII